MVSLYKGLQITTYYCLSQIGDHIASIDDVSVIGYRHYEVAKMLKEKRRGSTITLSLYEPIKLGFGKCSVKILIQVLSEVREEHDMFLCLYLYIFKATLQKTKDRTTLFYDIVPNVEDDDFHSHNPK